MSLRKGLIVGGTDLSDEKHIMVFTSNALLLLQSTLQGMFIAEASKRVCTSRYQMLFKPGRQIVTFLLFANITLWLLDTFMSHNWMTQELQFSFYGFLAWGIISRLALPLLVFYRFHSAVVLIEIWKNTYRTKDVWLHHRILIIYRIPLFCFPSSIWHYACSYCVAIYCV